MPARAAIIAMAQENFRDMIARSVVGRVIACAFTANQRRGASIAVHVFRRNRNQNNRAAMAPDWPSSKRLAPLYFAV
jgi:hypothetical protein